MSRSNQQGSSSKPKSTDPRYTKYREELELHNNRLKETAEENVSKAHPELVGTVDFQDLVAREFIRLEKKNPPPLSPDKKRIETKNTFQRAFGVGFNPPVNRAQKPSTPPNSAAPPNSPTSSAVSSPSKPPTRSAGE